MSGSRGKKPEQVRAVSDRSQREGSPGESSGESLSPGSPGVVSSPGPDRVESDQPKGSTSQAAIASPTACSSDTGPARADTIPVEVAYATPERQLIIPLRVKPGTTALQAVEQSGITREFPGIDLANSPMGIFSNLLNGKDWPLPADYRLQEKDRVEIYRPLQIDPKQARLARARKKQRHR